MKIAYLHAIRVRYTFNSPPPLIPPREKNLH